MKRILVKLGVYALTVAFTYFCAWATHMPANDVAPWVAMGLVCGLIVDVAFDKN